MALTTTKIPVITREYYRVPVSLTVNGDVVNPTTLDLEWAIMAAGTPPGTSDWVAGSWETLTHGPVYLARVLVGDATTDVPLTRGKQYDAWLRITDNPERPARLVGQIQGT